LIEWLQDLPIDFCHKLGFTRRPPKLDCFRDLLMKLDTEALDRVLREWVLEFFPHAQDELLAILSLDGKTLCGSARVLKKGVHLLSLVAHGSRVVLAQRRVDEKTNEHKGALELLEEVLLKDVVIVGDALPRNLAGISGRQSGLFPPTLSVNARVSNGSSGRSTRGTADSRSAH
jgi:hypothetical protein